MSGQSGAAQGAEYGSIIPGWGTLIGAGIGAATDSATDTSGNPTPLVNKSNLGDPLSDPEAQMRIQQAKAQQMQAKGQAADILTGGAGINPTASSASQVLLGGK